MFNCQKANKSNDDDNDDGDDDGEYNDGGDICASEVSYALARGKRCDLHKLGGSNLSLDNDLVPFLL